MTSERFSLGSVLRVLFHDADKLPTWVVFSKVMWGLTLFSKIASWLAFHVAFMPCTDLRIKPDGTTIAIRLFVKFLFVHVMVESWVVLQTEFKIPGSEDGWSELKRPPYWFCLCKKSVAFDHCPAQMHSLQSSLNWADKMSSDKP